jgi:hypothetical protein
VVGQSLQKTLILKKIKEQGARTVGEDTPVTEEAVASTMRHPFLHPQLKTLTQHQRTRHIPTTQPRERAIKCRTVPKGAGATCSVSSIATVTTDRSILRHREEEATVERTAVSPWLVLER